MTTTNPARTRQPVDLDEVVAQLRRLFAGQARLPPERMISEQLGIKRHQIRRGLEVLRAQGEFAPPRPRRAPARKESPLSEMVANTNPVEVVEMRLMMEPTLARLAARRATPNQIAAMEKAIQQTARGEMRPNGENDLHRLIAVASGNGLAEGFHRLLRRIETDTRLKAHFVANRDQQDYVQHKAIVDAIARRDAEEAERQMRLHIEALRQVLLADSH